MYLLPILFGVIGGIAANLSNPQISNITLIIALVIGVMSGMTADLFLRKTS